jgi:hypothetical protein
LSSSAYRKSIRRHIGRVVGSIGFFGSTIAFPMSRSSRWAASKYGQAEAAERLNLWRRGRGTRPGEGTGGVTVGSATPQPLGGAAAGTSGNASREDHVHAMPSASDVGAAVAVHTHGTTDIVGFTASIQEFANVKSVQGRTGDVVLTLEDVTGAAAVHTHSTTDIVGFTTVANVVSVNGITGTPSIVAGANVTVTTSASSIVVTAGGGGGDEGGGGIALSYLFS